MHTDHGRVPEAYRRYLAWKVAALLLLAVAVAAAVLVAVSVGPAGLEMAEVLASLAGVSGNPRAEAIVRGIRLPQAVAGAVAGGGLAVAGAVMQAVLRNPLGSPFTLGISHAAAFGAAFAVTVLGAGQVTSGKAAVVVASPLVVSAAAFAASLGAAMVIVAVARLRGARPEVMVLTGVALGSLATAATMLLQFFASDVQLAAMVFWTFGDTSRATWAELLLMGPVMLGCFLALLADSWRLNAMDAGDDTARGLGVRVEAVRTRGMILASLATAVVIAMLGVIGFVGLVVPHICRRTLGADHRFLLPACLLGGAVLLVTADTAARLVLAPYTLPVAVLTAFLGAPVFLALILRGRRS